MGDSALAHLQPYHSLRRFMVDVSIHQHGLSLHSLVSSYCIQDLYGLKNNFLTSWCNVGDQLYSWRKTVSPASVLHMYVLVSQVDENETTN